MLSLSGKAAEVHGFDDDGPRTLIAINCSGIPTGGAKEGYLFKGNACPPGFHTYLTFPEFAETAKRQAADARLIVLPSSMEHLGDGDIIRLVPQNGSVRVLFRTQANANYFLTTERCNHLCLMCSQPPKNVDDAWLYEEIDEVLQLLDANTEFIGLSGGEPTLYREAFLRALRTAKTCLPDTAVHILTNGRSFADREFARRYSEIGHGKLSVGIPLYAADPEVHDYVVQASGAFDETIRGIVNLKAAAQYVEIRVVVHKQTYRHLSALAEFIFRNLTFVDRIALMGLEITGFTRANLDDLWIDPWDYRTELRDAVRLLDSMGMNVSIYNHQLCVLDPEIRSFAVKSISDWKNEYYEECRGCAATTACGGFFSSSNIRKSGHISPIISGRG